MKIVNAQLQVIARGIVDEEAEVISRELAKIHNQDRAMASQRTRKVVDRCYHYGIYSLDGILEMVRLSFVNPVFGLEGRLDPELDQELRENASSEGMLLEVVRYFIMEKTA